MRSLLNYENLTVVSLKSILSERGLPVSGRKSILIERLRNDDTTKSSKKVLKVSKTSLKILNPSIKETKTESIDGFKWRLRVFVDNIKDLDKIHKNDIINFIFGNEKEAGQEVKSVKTKSES